MSQEKINGRSMVERSVKIEIKRVDRKAGRQRRELKNQISWRDIKTRSLKELDLER